jgi:ATP-dependent DNA helicase RecG
MNRVTHYTDAELEAMSLDIESDLFERKASFAGDSPTKIRIDVCAYANDLPDHRRAGVIFIGANNDGTPSGLKVTDPLLCTLADIKTDGRIVPPPTLTVEKHMLRGAEMAVIQVEPSDSPPVRFDGRVHIRIGSRRAIASAQDERILNEKRRFRDLPFDIRPAPSARLGDLSRRLFEEEYLPSAFAPDVLEANNRGYEQQLAACKMIALADDPTPTILGLLTLSTRSRDFLPGDYVQFLRIEGTEYDAPISDEAQIDGPLSRIVRRLDEKLSSHNRVAVDFTSSSRERRVSHYPMVALQQLTRNAILHRTYEATHAPVRVYWFDDRIEIHSPGGPFGGVTLDNFGKPGVTDYRNPNIAEAMKVFGFVQRFGFGIQLARKELEKNGNPELEFECSPEAVLCRVRPSRASK